MSSLLKSLLGNNTSDQKFAEEMRAVLEQLQQERKRAEALTEATRDANERLQNLGEPLAKAGADVGAVFTRLTEAEAQLQDFTKVVQRFQVLEERASDLARVQEFTATQVTQANENSAKIREVMEDLAAKAELADSLKEQLTQFLEIEKPFQVLRSEADAVRAQVASTGEHVARLREQHDRLLDAHKTAMSKMEALDRRRDDLGRSLSDKERRVAGVEEAVHGIDGMQATLDDTRREIGTLKAMADLVSQKTSALEAQRDGIDRALAQAEHLDRAMRQIDAGVRQQQENEKTLAVLVDQLGHVRQVHEQVVERSHTITQLQREVDERTQVARNDLAAVTEETKKSLDRFDFERRGIESVTQRVADLRIAVSDCENKFKGLTSASQQMIELRQQGQQLAEHVAVLTGEAARVDAEMQKLGEIRRGLDDTSRNVAEIGTQYAQLASVRPAAEEALRDLEQLRGAQALVKDALEQTQLVHGEIARVRETQSQTRDWLGSVERSLNELRAQAHDVRAMAPSVEFVEKQTQRIGDSMAAIESKRQVIEDLQVRMTDLEALSVRLDERGRDLSQRANAAEQRLVLLTQQSEEAERMTMQIASVNSGLNEAKQEASEVKKAVTQISERAESVEALAEKTQALKKEIEQRQHSLNETSKTLNRASELRKEAAETADQLEETSKELAAAVAKAEQRTNQVSALSGKLEDRVAALQAVSQRLEQFEARLAAWEHVDENVARSLESIATRQETVSALKADLDRMLTLAEKTSSDVREITSAHREIEESRELLKDVSTRMKEVRETAGTFEERKRQLAKAEDRLGRVEGVLADVRSSLEALQGQKSLVDQAVEKSGTLQILLKQAEATMDGLREERKTSARMKAAVTSISHNEGDEDDDESVEQHVKAKRAA